MCGIAGLVYSGGTDPEAAPSVRRMIELQRHRGPDGEGLETFPGAALGHCRLSIIDLSSAGDQPMADASGRYWLTFCGELYNFIELRHELEGHGATFRSRSDSEVLLAAYLHWGAAALSRFRGMFSFAVWDRERRELFAARDRFGIKPFHYCLLSDGRLAFATELKALLELLPERRANSLLAGQFLAWNLLDHDPEETLVSGIKRLPGGHFLRWSAGHGLSVERYWQLTVGDEGEGERQEREDLPGEFRERFTDAIRCHLRSDVPIGSALSGGLDSSAVVTVASRELKEGGHWQPAWQHAFTACFDDPRLDERPYVEAVAGATGCQTHFTFPSAERFAADVRRWLWHLDEPATGTGSFAHFCVAALAGEHGVRILLDGQGGDELLAGYRKFIPVFLRQLWKQGRWSRALAEAAMFGASPAILSTTRLAEGRRYLLRAPSELGALWHGADLPPRPAGLGLGSSLRARLAADLTHFSLPVLLRYEDRNSMAFGIESRVPFLDHELAEWALKLPAEVLLHHGWSKWILRQGLRDLLPKRVARRKTKLGFSTPENRWMRDALVPWLRDCLSNSRHLCDLFDRGDIRRILDSFLAGRVSRAHERLVFRLATYETWARLFLETAASREMAQPHASGRAAT
ncbi:MAG TPA: asparagine synthase (glutamine-hydrolyzing) [Thermoanaerobaculia bacterium]|nr:asparagine synthase (glutamine-hydrolyzing) [Thermoanaerobaculia bacterium]